MRCVVDSAVYNLPLLSYNLVQALRGRIEHVLGPMVEREVEGRSEEEEGHSLVGQVAEKVFLSQEYVLSPPSFPPSSLSPLPPFPPFLPSLPPSLPPSLSPSLPPSLSLFLHVYSSSTYLFLPLFLLFLSFLSPSLPLLSHKLYYRYDQLCQSLVTDVKEAVEDIVSSCSCTPHS